MADDQDTTKTTEQPAATGVAGTGASASNIGSGGETDATAIDQTAGNATSETPKEAAKDPKKDPSVAGAKLFAGQNTPANGVDPRKGDDIQVKAASLITPHKITGIDVTQPPALDLDSGLSRTTLFERKQDDKAAGSS